MNKNKKKILIFTQHFWPEEFRINDICKGFIENGYFVDIICGIPNYPTGKIYDRWGYFKRLKEKWNNINIKRVWEIHRGNNSLLRILINFISWPFFCLLYLPFIGKKYDRILVYQLSPVFIAFPAIIYKYLFKVKLTIYICDYWPFSVFAVMNIKNKLFKNIIEKISSWHYKQADNIVASFEGIKEMLIKDVGIKEDKIIYIPQACEKLHETVIYDENIFQKYCNKYCIVFTGSINPAQSFDIILPAAKLCYEAGYNNIHYVIVGNGMSKNAIEEEVKNIGLENNFHFEGFHTVEDMPKYYYIANAFIVALKKSILGSFGIPAKIQSYFAAGKPIIAAMDGDASNLINNNKVGYCGPADNIEILSKNIIKLYNLTNNERNEMGVRAKEYHYKYFERDLNLNKLINFMFN